MFVIHTHWHNSHRPSDPSGILFWAESSEQFSLRRGRMPRGFLGKPHPFVMSADLLRERIGDGTPLFDAPTRLFELRLPTAVGKPLPSPDLNHNWELDTEAPTRLVRWTVPGLWLPAGKAFSILVNLPELGPDNLFKLGQDTLYWRMVSNLVLEVLAGQKMLPTLVQIEGNGHRYDARWLPVLDGPQDGQRMAQLAAAMPPACRSGVISGSGRKNGPIEPPSARVVLDGFLRSICDSLVRSWGKSTAPHFTTVRDEPLRAWLMALFSEDAAVMQASNAQLQALGSSLRAWMRNLHMAGDSNFRIAFKLDPPEPGGNGSNGHKWGLHYLLQARDDPTFIVPARDIWRNGSEHLNCLGKRLIHPQEKLLAGLGYAAKLYPPILPSLQDSQPESAELDTNQAYKFLREVAPLMEQAGFGLLVPPWWNKPGARLGARLRLAPKQAEPTLSRGKLGLSNLVSYQWELALGETTLTEQEFKALAALKQPLIQLRGQWVQLDPEQIEAAIKFWETQNLSGELNLLEAARYKLGGAEAYGGLPVTAVVADDWISDWLDRLSDNDKMAELPQPQGMTGQLRPYQRFGFSWLVFFRRWSLGACLADDMGLGKTIQALALLQYEKEERGKLPGPSLLICPTSVVTNWEREVRRFTPGLRTFIHQGPNRLHGAEFGTAARDSDLVLTSYTIARLDADQLHPINWFGVVLDEAQNIKNPSAKQTQAVRKLNAGFRLALTGTPVENRLSELWSIMNFLNPGYLGSKEYFRQNFGVPIERFGDKEITGQLKRLVGPFILRRLKTDPRVIQDLPEKIETKEYCSLTEEQGTLYEAIVQETMAKVQGSDGIARRGQVLSLLMQLKQLCNHPLQFMHQVENAGRADVEGRSGKLNRLIEMLEEMLEVDDRALIFTQFAELGRLLADYLPPALGKTVLFLHGGTPTRMRDQMIKRFQEDEHGPPIFILSLKAGGLGLNLTRANHVFHFDRWWNPAVENQATDRAFRIGQKSNVQVHKFITTGTLEEKIDEMIESKKGLAESVIGEGEDWLTELSTDDLRDLVKLRR
jgi:SNF2 family DNA or RNA helicase